jgi:glycerol-3-phosphate acyltransferase PlsY
LADFAKGAVAVGAAQYFGLRPLGVIMAMHAVVIGHIWPLQLGFQGGKGIATGIGALVVFDYKLALVLLSLFGFSFPLLRRFTLSGLMVVAASPLVAGVLGNSYMEVAGLSVLVVIILIAHRTNIRNLWSERRGITL